MKDINPYDLNEVAKLIKRTRKRDKVKVIVKKDASPYDTNSVTIIRKP